MSGVAVTSARREAFSPAAIVALILVGVVAFAGFAVLGAYAPELRANADPGAHALSSSAIGYRGATVMLKAEGVPVVVSRAPPGARRNLALVVLTPDIGTVAVDLKPFMAQPNVLVVLPKWLTRGQPLRPGYVDKVQAFQSSGSATLFLKAFAPRTDLWLRQGQSRPALHGAGDGFSSATAYYPLGPIDRLQTISGDGWIPALVDEQGRPVLVRSRRHPQVYVLSDPDLLNNQGLANLNTARAGLAILHGLRGDGGVVFDVTINGFSRGQGIARTMLTPPWLAATLCGVATVLLMGLHALARFGPVQRRGRVFALGKRALVDSSAGLVRMAGREAELAPAYAALTKDLIARRAGGAAHAASGEDAERWLADLARLRNAAAPAELTAEADRATTRDDLLTVGRRLYAWRLEMTRERR